MAKKPTKLKVVQLAEEIAKIRSELARIAEQTVDPLKEQEDILCLQLIEELKKQGMKTVSLEGVGVFTRAYRQNLKVLDPDAAMAWAVEKNALSIDKSKALKIIRMGQLATPAGFGFDETEFISVRKQGALSDE